MPAPLLIVLALTQTPPTPAQFKTVPPATVLQLGTQRITKKELLERAERDKQSLSIPAPPPTVEVMKATFTRNAKQQLATKNAQLRTLAQSVGTTVSRAASALQPTVTQVIAVDQDGKQVLTPGGYVVLKGANLQAFQPGKSGKVMFRCPGLPGGFITLKPLETGTPDGTSVLAEVDDSLTGVNDGLGKLVLVPQGGSDIQVKDLPFMARRENVNIRVDQCVTVSKLGEEASLTNYTALGQYVGSAVHINIPTYPATAGMDTYRIKLAPSWKYDTIIIFPGGVANVGVTHHLSADTTQVAVQWKAPSSQTHTPPTPGVNQYSFTLWATGPAGTQAWQ